jgi:hypothetical protein
MISSFSNIMLKIKSGTNHWVSSRWFAPLVLGWIALAAYGIFIPRVGFYGEDWSYIWLLYGPGDISPFFENNREALSFVYSFLARFLGQAPWQWQIAALITRWLSALAVYLTLLNIWPSRSRRALWVGIIFLVYPAFYLQANSVTFMVVHLVLALTFFSFRLTIQAQQQTLNRYLAHTIALLLSLTNLLLMEYFYLLELIRLPLIYCSLEQIDDRKVRIIKALKAYIPYLIVFITVSIWRVINQQTITGQYRITLVDMLLENPQGTLAVMLPRIFGDIWQSTFGSWWQVIILPERANLVSVLANLHWVVVSVAFLLLVWQFIRVRDQSTRIVLWRNPLIWMGMTGLVLGGVVVWLPGLQPSKDYSTSRLYLPFMAGSAFLLIGLIESVQINQVWKSIFFAAAVSLAIGTQFTFQSYFMQDWTRQREFFWQLAWRMPDLPAGTTIIADRLPSRHGEENSQSAALNLIYSEAPVPGRVDYYIYFIPERIEFADVLFETGVTLNIPHRIGNFTGTSDQVIGLHLDERNCIRTFHPVLDGSKSELPPFFRRLARKTTTSVIPLSSNQRVLPEVIFGREPEHDWCYLFQQADIARQSGKWAVAVEYADRILSMDEMITDQGKYALFVEAYARTGRWDRVEDIITDLRKQSRQNQKWLCVLVTYLESLNLPGGLDHLPPLVDYLKCE